MKIRHVAAVAWGLLLCSSFDTLAQPSDTGAEPGKTARTAPLKQHVWTDGARYEGDWEKGQPHGYGTLSYADGSQYWGRFERGRRHGFGKLKYKNGDQYEGNWLLDHPNGRGKLIYANGSVYEGSFKDGKHEGLGKQTFTDGTFYEGTWKEDKPHGFGKLTFVSGGLYEGAFSKGKPSGKGRYFYPNGDIYSGQWKAGNQDGTGRIDYSAGGYYEGEFVDGMRHGEGELMSALGQRYSGPFEYNEAHGEGLCSNQGKPSPCKFVRDKRVNRSTVASNDSAPATTRKLTSAAAPAATAVTLAAATLATPKVATTPTKVVPKPKDAPKPIADPVAKTAPASKKPTPAATPQSATKPKPQAVTKAAAPAATITAPAPVITKSKPAPTTVAKTTAPAATAAVNTPPKKAKATKKVQLQQREAQPFKVAQSDIPEPKVIAFSTVYSEQDSAKMKVPPKPTEQVVAKTAIPDSRQQFTDIVDQEKTKIKHLSITDLRQDRSDIYFNDNWDEKDLMAVPELAWWQKKASLFSDSVQLVSKHGDTEIRMVISDYKGPGSYKPEKISVRSEPAKLKADQMETGVVVIESETEGWISGTFEFKVKDKTGKSLAFDHGVFHLSTKDKLPGFY